MCEKIKTVISEWGKARLYEEDAERNKRFSVLVQLAFDEFGGELLCDLWEISPRTLSRWANRGAVPHVVVQHRVAGTLELLCAISTEHKT